jgi:cytochrome P450
MWIGVTLCCSTKYNLVVHILHRLPYNEAFLREVMRKETLVPISIVHRATEDTELAGYSIPKVSYHMCLCKIHIKIVSALLNQ